MAGNVLMGESRWQREQAVHMDVVAAHSWVSDLLRWAWIFGNYARGQRRSLDSHKVQKAVDDCVSTPGG